MEIAYLHVVINHLPIMGVPIALGLLLLGIWAKNDSIKRASFLAFFLLQAGGKNQPHRVCVRVASGRDQPFRKLATIPAAPPSRRPTHTSDGV